MNKIESIAVFLKKIRLENNQERMMDMAKKLGISVAYLSSIENEKRPLTEKLIEEIVAIYNLDHFERERLFFYKDYAANQIKVRLNDYDPDKKEKLVEFLSSIDQLDIDDIEKMNRALKKRKSIRGNLMQCKSCGYEQAKQISETTYQCPMCHTQFTATPSAPKTTTRSKKLDYSRLLESVITLKTPNGLGVGTVIDEKGYVLTNAHIIGDEAFCYGQFSHQANLYECTVIASGDAMELDLALLKIEDDQAFKAFSLKEVDVEIGEDVLAIGNPKGIGLSVVKGTVAQTKEKHILLDMSINPGNSGGPVLNQAGELVGIISFRVQELQGFAFAVNKYTIQKFLDSVEFKED